MAKRSEGGLADLRDELGVLQTSLREEQLHSTELKKEVERLASASVNKEVRGQDQERDMYKEQVLALEEGKALCEYQCVALGNTKFPTPLPPVTSEVVSLRRQLSDAQLTSKEKEKLLDKAAQLAAENVSLKASMDELAGQKSAMEGRLRLMEEELKQKWVLLAVFIISHVVTSPDTGRPRTTPRSFDKSWCSSRRRWTR